MTPEARIIQGKCLAAMRKMPDASVDAVVTDPPYGLRFMGQSWDYQVPSCKTWAEVLRVLKPGGHLLSFFGTRTYHRGVVNIEDAGFIIRDQLAWVYGSGFPKSLDVSKAIVNRLGTERETVRIVKRTGKKAGCLGAFAGPSPVTTPASEEAQQWEGWGTALKPAWEPICLARKPLIGTVAENVLQHGTGGLNIDGCRIAGAKPATTRGAGGQNGRYSELPAMGRIEDDGKGRFPANLVHDGSEEVLEAFGQFGEKGGGDPRRADGTQRLGVMKFGGEGHRPFHNGQPRLSDSEGYLDSGTAARFFYTAKASRAERGKMNTHPTVKPVSLMRWLVRLVTPKGGLVLDPFMGSGSTGVACIKEGFRFIGIEVDPKWCAIAQKRIGKANYRPTLFDGIE